MKIIQSELDNLCICPVTVLQELVLNLKTDCSQKGIHPNNIHLRTNVDTLLTTLKHPMVYGIARNEFELEELLGGVVVTPYKDQYHNTVCAYHEGVILDTILFYF